MNKWKALAVAGACLAAGTYLATNAGVSDTIHDETLAGSAAKSVPDATERAPPQVARTEQDRQLLAERYALQSKCARVQRLSQFFDRQGVDPHSWLKDDAAMEAVSSQQLDIIEKNVRFVSENEAECAATSFDSVSVYETALTAALSGHRDAAACYLFAQWPLSGPPFPQRVYDDYVEYAPRLVAEGVEAGDWRVVAAKAMAPNAGTGLLSALHTPQAPQDALRFVLLQQLGADEADASMYDNQIAHLSSSLTEQEIEASRQWAAQHYRQYFSDKGPSIRDWGNCDF